MALQAVNSMNQHRCCISISSLYCLLQACILKKDLLTGREVCSLIMKHGIELSTFIGSHLIRMFAVCGSLSEATQVFEKLHRPNVFSWCAIISAHTKAQHSEQAIDLYHQMQHLGVKPDGHVYAAVLQACARAATLTQGKLIHMQIMEGGFQADEYIGSTLMDMYSQCGSLVDARKVFDNLLQRGVVTWSAMIAEYAHQGDGWEALNLFKEMQQVSLKPDSVTFASTLKACSSIKALDQGDLVYAHAIERGCDVYVIVTNTLIDMYAKCGSLGDAHRVFDRVPNQDVVTWSVMIVAYAQHGCPQEALQHFQRMQWAGVNPNEATFVCILGVCSSIAAIDEGKLIHTHAIENGCELDVNVGSALVGMYAKCGNLLDAQNVFEELPYRTVVTWSAMIEGLAQHNKCKRALELFEDMQGQGLKPDEGTFISLLSACGHAGLKERGCHVFKSVTQHHGITPTLEHYNCMVDILGRAGSLDEAEDLLLTLETDFNFVGWLTLLSHCRSRGNVALGRRCFGHIVHVDCMHAAAYVLMSSIYAHANMWEDVHKLEDSRKNSCAWNNPGNDLNEACSKVFDSVVGDSKHPQNHHVNAKLDRLHVQLKETRFVPGLTPVQLAHDDYGVLMMGREVKHQHSGFQLQL